MSIFERPIYKDIFVCACKFSFSVILVYPFGKPSPPLKFLSCLDMRKITQEKITLSNQFAPAGDSLLLMESFWNWILPFVFLLYPNPSSYALLFSTARKAAYCRTPGLVQLCL